ncbi:MAG TPA: hypothetical protein VMW32_02065 [Bacteroidales bacterium]|nr:hypothetical protein [Bacteroidales bacterium]
MKTLDLEKTKEIFSEFALTNEEMICVRGGDAGEPLSLPSSPKVKI